MDARGTICMDTCCELGGYAPEAFMEGFANGLPDDLIIRGCLKAQEDMERLLSEWSQERVLRRTLSIEGRHQTLRAWVGRFNENCVGHTRDRAKER